MDKYNAKNVQQRNRELRECMTGWSTAGVTEELKAVQTRSNWLLRRLHQYVTEALPVRIHALYHLDSTP